MPKQHYIKDLRNREGCSINDIAKRTRTNWRTAKKYADEDQVPQELTFQKRGLMYDHDVFGKRKMYKTANIYVATCFPDVLRRLKSHRFFQSMAFAIK
ncbi:hypothetical protein [Salisediminibacterium halotolerans]|nr:hypothetical protein [Salisediminibacterium haloalkalitolerans]